MMDSVFVEPIFQLTLCRGGSAGFVPITAVRAELGILAYMIVYRLSPDVQNRALNVLFDSAWDNFKETDFVASFNRCALWVCANDGETLVGFVKVVWDGGIHGFVLDTTVHPDYQRRGIGQQLLRRAADASKACGIEILHVDFEPHLTQFYRDAGYKQTEAGLLRLFCKGQ